MTELSGKQKRYLRGLGQTIPTGITIGKAALSDDVLREAAAMLERHELLKVRLPVMDRHDRSAFAQDAATRLDAALVGVVGHTLLLFKPSAEASKRRIQLP